MHRTATPSLNLRTIAAILMIVVTLGAAFATPALAQGRHRGDARPATQSEFQQVAVSAEGTQVAAEAPAAPEFSGEEVLVAAGQDIQAAVDANPAGTHFRIGAGVHRLAAVEPKDGNTFIGEAGAVLSGATELAAGDFRRDGAAWVIGGQTAEGFIHGETEPGFERDAAPNELFLDGARAQHVTTRAAVTEPGTWFFDYDRNEVVMFDDPAAFSSIELSVVEAAFRSSASDVTIANLTIVRYASPAQHGAIHADDSFGWTVANTTVIDAHGTGIRVGPGFHLTNSRVIGAGQLGVGGNDRKDGRYAPVTVEFTEITRNRTLNYAWGWEGGATKFALTDGLVFRNNWVHDNYGPGVWLDVDTINSTIEGNIVEENDQAGVFVEISSHAAVRQNVIRNNGRQGYGDLGAGVHVSTSSDVEVSENAIYGNRAAVMVQQEDRGEGPRGTREVINLKVNNNEMVPGEVPTGIRVHHGDEAHYWFNAGNTFSNNTYHVAPQDIAFWSGDHLDMAGWQNMGFDADGNLADPNAALALPAAAQVFLEPVALGATA